MTLAFNAKFVNCTEAIEGQILQVAFETLPPWSDEHERKSPYVLISRDFEFSDPPTIEWHDGYDYDGGAEIGSLTLGRAAVSIQLDGGTCMQVSFQLPDRRFKRLRTYLGRMMDDRIRFTD